jgi:DNA-binding transcriptional ArsR family regulator
LIVSKNGNIVKIRNDEVMMERLELLLHPIRMRLILALGNRTLTTQQLADMLPDVAQTTLYRQINLLLDGGIVTVVRESKVRGTLERELALVQGAGRIDMQTAATLSPEDREQMFTTFVATLLSDFRHAESQPVPGMPPAIYTQQRLYLTTDELQALNERMDALLAPYKDPSRTLDGAPVAAWKFTGIVMADADPQTPDEEQSA